MKGESSEQHTTKTNKKRQITKSKNKTDPVVKQKTSKHTSKMLYMYIEISWKKSIEKQCFPHSWVSAMDNVLCFALDKVLWCVEKAPFYDKSVTKEG